MKLELNVIDSDFGRNGEVDPVTVSPALYGDVLRSGWGQNAKSADISDTSAA